MAFTNPAFLWAMGLAIIPLWLHLSHRRKFRKLETGTLRFLKDARRPRRRKARWEEILLMLLRIGATLLLALMFARPACTRSNPVENENARLLVMLDASGSITERMAEEAKKSAERVLGKEGKRWGTVTLAQFSDRVERITALPDFQPRGGAPTRLDRAMDWALDHLLETGATKTGKLVLIGHFALASLPETPPRLWPAGIEVELVSLTPKDPINAAVTGVDLRTPFKTDAMEIEARLHLPAEVTPTVRLEAEGYVEEKTPQAGTERVLFQFRPPKDKVRGWITVTAESEDAWPLDNRRPFVFEWTGRSRVLLIDGDPGGTPFDGEAYFLKKALEASGAEHGLSPFAPEIAYGLETRTGLTDLSEVDAVALCGVANLSTAEVQLLRKFVDGGGGLFVVLGDGWAPELYTALADAGLFPRTSADDPGDALRKIESWDSNHPALAPFADPEGGDLGSLTWREGYTIQADDDWKALAHLESGRPILLGNDRILVCPHPLNREWSDLPREPMFVPLVKSLFRFLTSAQAPPAPAEIFLPGIEESREPGWFILPDRPDQVVVTDAAEARVMTGEPDEIAAALGLPLSKAATREAIEKTEAAEIARRKTESARYEWWPWIALLLLAWLVIEGILATARPRGTGDVTEARTPASDSG